MEIMTKREVNLKIFEKKTANQVLFQPRIEWWYQYNKIRGTLPPRYQKMDLLELFDDLDVSIRYFSYATGLPDAIRVRHSKKPKEKIEGEKRFLIYDTPKGELVEESKQSSDGAWRILKFLVETIGDIEKAIWLFENTSCILIRENFEKGSKFVGERGEPQFFVPRSGYQRLAIELMGIENLIYLLVDFPKKVERLMQAINNSYDSLYEDIISYGKVKIINFGENIDANIVPPRYFEKYCLPFYDKRSRQLQKAGIYTHIHIDGSFKPLSKYLKDLPFDGLEALTPLPQGDVSLEEMKDAVGEKILLDGIPAIIFLPDYPLEKFKDFIRKIIELFWPRLILGASDEVPPPADIERVRIVSEIVNNFNHEKL
jgi:hypothetical protein